MYGKGLDIWSQVATCISRFYVHTIVGFLMHFPFPILSLKCAHNVLLGSADAMFNTVIIE